MFSIRQIINPTDEELDNATLACHIAFGKQFFAPALDTNPDLSYRLIRAQLKASSIEGLFYVAELTNPKPGQNPIIGAAAWFGPGQKLRRLKTECDSGWEETISSLSPENQKWWPGFFEEFDGMCEKALGSGVKLGGYHLQLLAVIPGDPEDEANKEGFQKKGVARALDRAVELKAQESAIEQGKPQGYNMCVECMANKLVVYKSLGYELKEPAGTITAPGGQGHTFEMFSLIKSVGISSQHN